jgi:hypothetical protein
MCSGPTRSASGVEFGDVAEQDGDLLVLASERLAW